MHELIRAICFGSYGICMLPCISLEGKPQSKGTDVYGIHACTQYSRLLAHLQASVHLLQWGTAELDAVSPLHLNSEIQIIPSWQVMPQIHPCNP